MENLSRELSIIAYYLSEYDMKAVHELGYKTRTEAFQDISIKLGRENNYLKLRRDEFDVLTSSSRNGWENRPVNKDVKLLFDELSIYDYESITIIVKDIINGAIKSAEDEIADQIEDKKYIENVNRVVKCNVGKKNLAEHPKQLKVNRRYNVQSLLRDPTVAANALCNADYKCEICASHPTFIRKSNRKPYTEPHHLVPMKAQKDFTVSLDVENNVVSLCSNCHNQIHYGENVDDVLKYLYDRRKDTLSLVGINLSYDELKKYYN